MGAPWAIVKRVALRFPATQRTIVVRGAPCEAEKEIGRKVLLMEREVGIWHAESIEIEEQSLARAVEKQVVMLSSAKTAAELSFELYCLLRKAE